MNSELVEYIENEIIPLYSRNEEGHGINHIRTVIRRSLEISKKFDVDVDIVYTIAAYHDIGHYIDRKKHEIISADIFMKDKNIEKWFDKEKRILIKEAIEDHRASSDREPRSIYGKIVSTADRTILDFEDAIMRTYHYGKKYYPNKTEEEQLLEIYDHLQDKFGDNGYSKIYLEDEEYDRFIMNLRNELKDKNKFLEKVKSIIKKNTNN